VRDILAILRTDWEQAVQGWVGRFRAAMDGDDEEAAVEALRNALICSAAGEQGAALADLVA